MADLSEGKIVEEVSGKVHAFEEGNSQKMSDVADWADAYRITTGKRKAGRHSNPKSSEFFTSCNAMGGLIYRMLTASDPMFKSSAMHPGVSYPDLKNLEDVLNTQLRVSEYRKYLLKACQFVVPFGTVIAEESWKTIGINQFRKIPTTTFRPRVLDQVAFDKGTIEIDDADWIATMDIVSKSQLYALLRDAKDGKNKAWNKKALRKAIDNEEGGNTISPHVLNRLRRANPGATDDELYGKKMELIMYYGKLDAANDGFEYVCGIINRKILVRFHANNFQHGRRQFRVGKFKDFDSHYGLGVGDLLGNEIGELDSVEAALRDSMMFSSYNMWAVKKNTVNIDDIVVRPNNIIEVEDHNDMKPLDTPVGSIQAGQGLLDFLQQKFRNAAGAPDELQALVSEATTATQSSLAQNSAMRNIAIIAEMLADPLCKQHLEVMHANNIMNLKSPIDIERAGEVSRVYPRDLKFDADFTWKTVTDKDYTPKRLTELQNLLTTLISTKSAHPDQMNISILPIVKEIAHQLNVDPEAVLQSPQAPADLPQEDLMGLGGGTLPPLGGEPTNEPVVDTPVGPTIVGP